MGLPKTQIESRLIKDEAESKTEENGKIPTIKLTTHVGSKGLSGGRVFIVSFNNGDFPHNSNKITENEVNMLIVDITRTVRQCYLVSNWRFGLKDGIRESEFLNWFDREAIQTVKVNREYFQNLEKKSV